MHSGEFDRLISIDYKTTEPDPTYGTPVVVWRRLTRCPAQIRDILPSRSESVRYGLEVARNQLRIRIRYRPDVTSDMRIVAHGNGDEVLEIVGGPAVVGGRQRYLELVCERSSVAGGPV